MMNTKKEFLNEIDRIYIKASSKLLNEIQLNKENIDNIKERSDILKEIYEKGKMKVEELKEDLPYKPIGEAIETYKEKAEVIAEGIKDKIENIVESINKDEEE